MLQQTDYQQQRKTDDAHTVNKSSFTDTFHQKSQQRQAEQEAFERNYLKIQRNEPRNGKSEPEM